MMNMSIANKKSRIEEECASSTLCGGSTMKNPHEHELKTSDEYLKKSVKYKYSTLLITLIYTVFGIAWISFSDDTLNKLVSDKDIIREISIIKGWIYVLITALLIYSLVSSLVKKIKKEEGKLISSYKEISTTNEKLEESQKELHRQYKILVDYKEKLYQYAYQDHLTQLPNRRFFYSDLTDKVQQLQEGKRLTLLLMDVDNFKYVNDEHGHEYGDKVIIHIGECIKEHLLEGMSLYRIGGDEFAIFIEGHMTNDEIEWFAKDFMNNFNKKFYQDYKIPISLSMGISILPDHTNDHNDLVKYADVALFKAKDAGKGTSMLFEIQLKEFMEQKINFENLLKQALGKKEFILYYQPQIDLKTGKIRGFEALIRWFSKELGMVSPAKFIPIAEETKLINDIGRWVLEEAVAFISRLNRERNSHYTISVNISPIQWMNDDFEDMILNTLKKFNLPEEQLELEITESILMNSFEKTIKKMRHLRELGIKVALDDFGTGYSSLNYLKQMPITTLKIDKTFIDDLFSERSNQSILNAIISLGHTIGLEVVAEGVETGEQVSYLCANKCDNIQGYIFSKPISEVEIVNFIEYFKFDSF